MPNTCILLLDQGGHSTRALLIDVQGNILAHQYSPITTYSSSENIIEHDSQEVLHSLEHCLNAIALDAEKRQLIPIAAGLIVQRSSFLAVNSNTGQVLSPILSWQDTRQHQWLEQQALDKKYIQRITGLYANAHYGASKMHGLLQSCAAVQQAATADALLFSPLASFLAQAITQNIQCQVSSDIASRTLLFDINQQQWDSKLLAFFGITKQQLPAITNDYCPPQSASTLMLGEHKIPLCLVAGDQSFLLMKIPYAQRLHSVMVNIGTGAFIQRIINNDEEAPAGLLKSHIGSGSTYGFSVLEGTVNAAASALTLFYKKAGRQLSAQEFEAAMHDDENIPIYINSHAGIGSPHWLPAGEPRWVYKNPKEDTLCKKAVAIIESVIFLLMDNLQLMQESGHKISTIYIGGGLANSDGVCQKLADISGLTVYRCEEKETSALGAAKFLFSSLKRNSETHNDLMSFIPNPSKKALLRRYRLSQQCLFNLKKDLRN